MAQLNVRNVDEEKKRKTIFILKGKGTTISAEVKKMLDEYAEEFDKKNS